MTLVPTRQPDAIVQMAGHLLNVVLQYTLHDATNLTAYEPTTLQLMHKMLVLWTKAGVT